MKFLFLVFLVFLFFVSCEKKVSKECQIANYFVQDYVEKINSKHLNNACDVNLLSAKILEKFDCPKIKITYAFLENTKREVKNKNFSSLCFSVTKFLYDIIFYSTQTNFVCDKNKLEKITLNKIQEKVCYE